MFISIFYWLHKISSVYLMFIILIRFYSIMTHDKHNLPDIIVNKSLKSMYFIRYFPINVFFLHKTILRILVNSRKRFLLKCNHSQVQQVNSNIISYRYDGITDVRLSY